MNKHKLKASTAFSLIELSIVILIVGIIIAGITQSSRLVRQSKLKSAQTLTQSSPVASIKGISLWLETSLEDSFPSVLDNNSNLAQWNDINPHSSTKLFALPAGGTATSAITFINEGINGLPSISFTGAASTTANVLAVSTSSSAVSHTPIVTVSDPNAANAFTVFMVYKLNGTATSAYTLLYNGIGNANGWGYQKAATTGARTVMLNGTGTTLATTNALPTSQEMATIVYNGRTSTSATPADGITSIYTNGGTNFTSTTGNNARTGTATVVTQPTLNMYIGGLTGATAGAAPTTPWNGLISEIIIFDNPLKTQDLRDVANYLSKKYGITLS
jgi:type II secretory pathway pseudopilin PulG